MGSASLQGLAWAHLWYTWNRFQSLRPKLFPFTVIRHQPSTALTSKHERLINIDAIQILCTGWNTFISRPPWRQSRDSNARNMCLETIVGCWWILKKRLYPMKPETVYCAFPLSLVYLHIRKVFRGYLHSPKSHQWVTNITSRVPYETKNGHGSIF